MSFRLTPTELNQLLIQLMAKRDDGTSDQEITLPYRIHSHGKAFMIYPMSKDAESLDNEAELPFVMDVIKNFYEKNTQHDCTLLIPYRFCRGYCRVPVEIALAKRAHAVLLEINLSEKSIHVHDSQSWVPWLFYPDKLAQKYDKLNDIAQASFTYPLGNYHSYDIQKDDFSCGYYVYHFIKHILATGSALGCEKIQLNIKRDYPDKAAFLKQHGVVLSQEINGDEVQVIINGEEWQQFSVDENYYQEKIATENAENQEALSEQEDAEWEQIQPNEIQDNQQAKLFELTIPELNTPSRFKLYANTTLLASMGMFNYFNKVKPETDTSAKNERDVSSFSRIS